MHQRYLSCSTGFGILFPTAMPTMDSAHRSERREIRYPLHLPVCVKLAHQEMHALSENISLGGILLSSALLIPEGSTVELAVGVAAPERPNTVLSARGQVVRVQARAIRDFAVAIKLERSFEFAQQSLNSSSGSDEKGPPFPQEKKRTDNKPGLQFAQVWQTET
jgi:PilZ domain